MSNVAQDLTERIPGDPHYSYALFFGDAPMPPLTSARAKWNWRQAQIINDERLRSQMLLSIVDQFVGEMGPKMKAWTIAELRAALVKMIESAER